MIQGLSKSFGGVKALAEVSFEVTQGETVGVIGPNGSGKSTLLNAISGFVKPDAGRVTWLGDRVDGLPSFRVARRGVARSFQDSKLLQGETVRGNLRIAAESGDSTSAIGEALRLLSGRPSMHPHLEGRVEFVAEEFGVTGWLDRLASEAPSGVRNLVALACVQLRRGDRARRSTPHLWLLDEPFAGVDAVHSSRLRDTVRQLSADGSVTVVVDHRMSFLRPICDRLIVLFRGSVLADGGTEAILSNEDVIAAYLGEGALA